MLSNSSQFRAFLIVALMTFCFALSDVIGKFLALQLPVPVFAAGRYLTSFVILLVVFYPRIGAKLWATQRPWLLAFRGLLLSLATLTLGIALRYLPVAETISILYLSPFLVMILAVPLFGENVTPLGWFFAILGFSGVLFIIRPSGNLNGFGVLFALLNAGIATAFSLLTRKLAREEAAIVMIFFVTFIGALYFFITAIAYFDPSKITIPQIGLMMLLGVLATSGHFLMPIAYRLADASVVAPLSYLHIVWATVLGWVGFRQFPDLLALLGMGLIILSGIGIVLLPKKPAQNIKADHSAPSE